MTTITSLIKKDMLIGTMIITDEHSSNRAVDKNALCSHAIVNHSIKFKNMKMFHTNTLENLLSQLKCEEKKGCE